jgi:hypothetical protein
MALTYVGNSDLQTVTLDSGYTSGSGSMSLTAGHGARLPSAGNFWLRTTTGTYRAFKVTARSTDTLTVTSAQDGTSDGNLDAGQELAWVLTASALDELRIAMCGSMTVSAFDTATTTGTVQGGLSRVHLSDGLYDCVWNGSAWEYYFGGIRCYRPVNGDFSDLNSPSTVSTATGAITLIAAASGSINIRGRVKSFPGATFRIRAMFLLDTDSASSASGGLCLYDGTKVNTLAITHAGLAASGKYNSVTTWSGADYSVVSRRLQSSNVICMEIEYDSTNRMLRVGTNPYHIQTILTVTKTDFLTADRVGFFANSENSDPVVLTLLSWQEL